MKFAIINDQHFGVRNDSLIFHEYFKRFYSEVFFPYLEKNKITEVVDLGDTFDRRKYINYQTLDLCRKYYFDQLRDRGISLTLIAGNHDSFYKDTIAVNSPRLLLQEYSNIEIIDEPTEVTFGKTKIALIPWICQDNEKRTLELIASTKAKFAFGHLELQGFEMYKGAVIDHGYDHKIFDKFDLVATGHFHHKSTKDNINYLGAPYQMTWSDYDDRRGFHCFDTRTKQLEYIQNPLEMFAKIHYNGQSVDDLDKYKNMFVKVVVEEKADPYTFDLFIQALEKVGPADLQVVEDSVEVSPTDIDTDQEQDDTLSIINTTIDQLTVSDLDKSNLNTLFNSLYRQASEIQ